MPASCDRMPSELTRIGFAAGVTYVMVETDGLPLE